MYGIRTRDLWRDKPIFCPSELTFHGVAKESRTLKIMLLRHACIPVPSQRLFWRRRKDSNPERWIWSPLFSQLNYANVWQRWQDSNLRNVGTKIRCLITWLHLYKISCLNVKKRLILLFFFSHIFYKYNIKNFKKNQPRKHEP